MPVRGSHGRLPQLLTVAGAMAVSAALVVAIGWLTEDDDADDESTLSC